MNRREFLVSTGAAGIAAATAASRASADASPASQPVLMKLGDQTEPTNDLHLKYLARYSVRNICGYPQIDSTVSSAQQLVLLSLGPMRSQTGGQKQGAPGAIENGEMITRRAVAQEVADLGSAPSRCRSPR